MDSCDQRSGGEDELKHAMTGDEDEDEDEDEEVERNKKMWRWEKQTVSLSCVNRPFPSPPRFLSFLSSEGFIRR
eukprot:749078-Hanusia_phi.AAC.1